MEIDLSGMIDVIDTLVDYMAGIDFTVGSYSFSLLAVVAALGTLEAIEFILGIKKNNDDDHH